MVKCGPGRPCQSDATETYKFIKEAGPPRRAGAGKPLVGRDVAPSGYAGDRATVRQKKTGRPVRLTEQTRRSVDDYIKAAGKKPGEFLFSGRADRHRCMT